MTAWSALLDAYEASIDAAERALADDDADVPPAGIWTPPPAPGFDPDANELARYRTLAARDDAVRGQLAARMQALTGELADTRKQRTASRAYRRAGS